MRTILLTGIGAPGQVGAAVAQAFAARGDHVLLVGLAQRDVDERVSELTADGHRATAYACDLADATAVAALADRVGREHPAGLDAAVLMAGGFAMSGPVGSSPVDVFERQISINLRTAYLSAGAFLPLVRATRGALVFFASEAALPGARVAGVSGYAIAKTGVVTLMRAVAQEEAAAGVRANALAPGAIRTASNINDLGPDSRFVEREAVADVVLYLCSDAGASISGQVVHLAPRP
jgi:NAD(P)-dependent dehydrogenase (short-subunit alcohol dehydrogenase family)